MDWDALNQANKNQIKASLSPEEEKLQAEARQKTFKYDRAERYFLTEVDLTDETEQIQATKENIEGGTGVAKLFSCFKARPRLH